MRGQGLRLLFVGQSCCAALRRKTFPSSSVSSSSFGHRCSVRSCEIQARSFSLSLPVTSAINEFSSKESVESFLRTLSDDQRRLIYQSLHVEVLKDKYMNELASESHYLSKFGRPTASTSRYGVEDATGTLTEVSQKWLRARAADLNEGDESSSKSNAEEAKLQVGSPTAVAKSELFAVGLKNALPFIGFGFLDNLIMILAGDYIDLTIGAALGISTMAAAALGNTISDVAGIASASYVEVFAEKVGIHHPVLTPAQQGSWSVRWSTNMGRAIGVVIGCLMGMLPLAFLPTSNEAESGSKSSEQRHDSGSNSSSSKN